MSLGLESTFFTLNVVKHEWGHVRTAIPIQAAQSALRNACAEPPNAQRQMKKNHVCPYQKLPHHKQTVAF